MNAKVLWWRHGVSELQLLRVYLNDDQRAEEDLALARLDASRTWELTDVPAFINAEPFYSVHPDSEVQIP